MWWIVWSDVMPGPPSQLNITPHLTKEFVQIYFEQQIKSVYNNHRQCTIIIDIDSGRYMTIVVSYFYSKRVKIENYLAYNVYAKLSALP